MNTFFSHFIDTLSRSIAHRFRESMRAQRGFVILFAILISVIILLLGIGIFAISTKELALASLARESHIAFVAADTGTECMLRAESEGLIAPALQGGSDAQITCLNGDLHVLAYSLGSSNRPFLMGNLKLPGTTPSAVPTCVQLITFTDDAGMRVVRSRGFNVCDDQGNPVFNDPRLVERVLEFTFFAGGAIAPTGATGGGSPLPDDTGNSNPDDSGVPGDDIIGSVDIPVFS